MPTVSDLATGDFITEIWTDQVSDAINNFDAWTTYTPTLTNLSIGNGTLTGRYLRIGNFVFFTVNVLFGSTTSVTGHIYVNAPTTPATVGTDNNSPQSRVLYYDSSAATLYAGDILMSAAQNRLYAVNAAGTYASFTATSSTVPFTWATSDQIQLAGWYMSA